MLIEKIEKLTMNSRGTRAEELVDAHLEKMNCCIGALQEKERVASAEEKRRNKARRKDKKILLDIFSDIKRTVKEESESLLPFARLNIEGDEDLIITVVSQDGDAILDTISLKNEKNKEWIHGLNNQSGLFDFVFSNKDETFYFAFAIRKKEESIASFFEVLFQYILDTFICLADKMEEEYDEKRTDAEVTRYVVETVKDYLQRVLSSNIRDLTSVHYREVGIIVDYALKEHYHYPHYLKMVKEERLPLLTEIYRFIEASKRNGKELYETVGQGTIRLMQSETLL